ncbi:MAG: hypothetical protein JXM70_13175 [Pirellulales bacterium]|nr:hypothetical protein [Pirellulales bacterium]
MKKLLVLSIVISSVFAVSQAGEQLLYNGIRLPDKWPPRIEKLTLDPLPVPYLKSPPAVIPIDVGRQLFVDDFLIERTTLKRTFHAAQQHPANPVLQPDRAWEKTGTYPTAMVFSDGVWFDPSDGLYKMWYMGGYLATTSHATSRDGIHWEKPSLDVEPGTNVVLRRMRDSSIVWLDHREPDPQKRFKMFTTVIIERRKKYGYDYRTSPDGIHWSKPVTRSPGRWDRSTAFFNPFRNIWVFGLRTSYEERGRARAYCESPHPYTRLDWDNYRKTPWVAADRLDPQNPDPKLAKVPRQLYNLDGVAYESLLLGLFSIWQGDPGESGSLGGAKRNEILLGFSRDGFHWHRPHRRPFIGVDTSPSAWNRGNVQSAGGGCLIVGDKLYFYFSGRLGGVGNRNCTGLATLRRDGFASMDVDDKQGELTTRPLKFSGKHLFVNLDAPEGQLRVEVLDKNKKVIQPFSRENCVALSADKTLAPVKWKDAADLSQLAGKPVRFHFILKQGSLYSFWVSSEDSGASHGYVAAGGPGFTKDIDTEGANGYPD